MKFIIEKNELLKILKFAEKIIDSKVDQNIPLLNYLQIIINKTQSIAICNNETLTGHYLIDDSKIEIIEKGKILIKNKLLLDIVSKLEEDRIEITKIEDSVLLVKTKTFSSQINLINEKINNSEFDINNLKCVKLNTSLISEIYKKNSLYVYNNPKQIKPISGIYFSNELNENTITTLSTDTYRLAYLNSEYINENDDKFSFIFNTSTINVIGQTIKGDVEIYIDEINKKNIIKSENISLIDRSIVGEYPINIFLKAFNVKTNTKVVINKQTLFNNLELCKSIHNIERNPITTFKIANNKVEIITNSNENGRINKIVDLIEMNGNEIEISFNLYFMLSLIKNINSKNITMDFEESNKPFLIYGDDENFKELLLPVINNK